MIDSLLFLIFSTFFPSRVDFIRMGLGIKARYKKNKKQWDNHHVLVRNFITSAIENIQDKNNKSLLILGCGRLYDFPLKEINNFQSVTLVDADPLALFIAKYKIKKFTNIKVRSVFSDVSGVVDQFQKSITKLPQVQDGLVGFDNYDVVVSLNLLGQIPLYFLDRAESYNLKFNQQELLDFSDSLQVHHVSAVMKIAGSLAVFIYDKTFFFVEQDQAPWQEVPATKADIFEPYLGRCNKFDKWYWSVDQTPGQGAIHLIEARSLTV